jgi:regulator of cell morphogenesis and NO signaling
MPQLTAQTTILDLQRGPPALMQVLRSAGLYRDGDDPTAMLGQLCWTWSLNPAILLSMLQSANGPQEAPPLDVSPFLDMPLPDFVTHIEQVYHTGLRVQLPYLMLLTAEARELAPGDQRILALHKEVEQLAAELDTHLAHEEEALFPMIRAVAAGTLVTTRCGSAVGGPIACMENDHALAGNALRRLRDLTQNYTAPAAAVDMLDELREFDQDLREHMYLENELLFPRATRAQSRARPDPLLQSG